MWRWGDGKNSLGREICVTTFTVLKRLDEEYTTEKNN